MTKKTTIKKPDFLRILLWRGLICFLVLLLVCRVLYGRFENKHNEDINTRERDLENWVADSINNDLLSHPGNSELSINCINEISYVSALTPAYLGYEKEYRYDKAAINSEVKRVILYYKGNWYICYDKNVWDALESYQLNYFLPTGFILDNSFVYDIKGPIADSYYLNNETLEFYPGVVDGKDLSPKDKVNWEHHTDINLFSAMVVSNDEHVEEVYGKGAYIFYVADEKHTQGVFNGAHIYNSDFLVVHGKDFIKLTSALFVADLVVLSIWVFVVYTRRKNLYDMFAYRSGLTSKLAHDLKTPLMAISSSAENLLVTTEADKADKYKKQIIDNVYYMNDVITSVLQLARSESDRIIRDQEEIIVNSLVNNCLEKLEGKINENELTIERSEFKEIILKTDSCILSNAISCLLENATKYATKGSTISITNSDKIVLTVTNSFEGDIENVDSLTEPFVRGNEARGELGGSGLGLAIAKEDLAALGLRLNIKVDGNRFIASIINSRL